MVHQTTNVSNRNIYAFISETMENKTLLQSVQIKANLQNFFLHVLVEKLFYTFVNDLNFFHLKFCDFKPKNIRTAFFYFQINFNNNVYSGTLLPF